MHAAICQIAEIVGARIVIVTYEIVGHEETTLTRNATINGTGILVVAKHLFEAGALTFLAEVASGAIITVITRSLIELVDATEGGVADVIGAEIVVVTVQLADRCANPVCTVVPNGAKRPVIAEFLIGRVNTPIIGIAGIIGTDVEIVAIGNRAKAPAIGAMIVIRAGISIIARILVQLMEAADLGIAGVIGAGIVIVAVKHRSGGAQARLTVVSDSTWIKITALTFVGFEEASGIRITAIVSARILVVTGDGRTRLADAFTAHIVGRTNTTILAGGRVVSVNATSGSITKVISTRIAVHTIQRSPGPACTVGANFANSAGVAIVAGEPLVIWLQRADTTLAIAGRLEAGSIDTHGKFAFDFTVRNRRTLIGELGGVTVEHTVANVVVVKRSTVRIQLASTIDVKTDANGLLTVVARRARIIVVTLVVIWREDAATLGITGIVRADI